MAIGQQDSLVVRSVQLRGNERTRDAIVLRELAFSVGDAFSKADFQKLVERSRGNIMRLNLFISVDLVTEVEGKQVDVQIQLKERLYFLPLPIFYLADRSFNEWWYDRGRDLRRTIYGLQLRHENLTGNGDLLVLKGYAGFVPYLELSYKKPYIDKRQRMGLEVGIFYSSQKTLPFRTWNDKLDFYNTDLTMRTRRGGFVEYSLRNALYHFHTLRAGFMDMTVSDSLQLLNPFYISSKTDNHLTYFSFSYSYKMDRRDNLQYPLKGDRLDLRLNQFGLGVFDDVSQTDLTLRYEMNTPVLGNLYADASVLGKVSFPQEQLYPFITGLGRGDNLVRGYQLQVIDGQHVFLFKGNLKYSLFQKQFDLSKLIKIKQFNTLPISIFAKAFGDWGYVRNFFPERSNSILSNIPLWGGGVGLDIVTFYDAAVDFNYSINQFGEGRLYFSLKRAF